MQLRRSFALATGAILLTAPVLSSCGFNYATDRINTVTNGANARGGEFDVLGAFIVAAEPDSGTFIATLTNNSESEPITFDSVQGGSGNTVTASDFAPVEIAPLGSVNLVQNGGVKLSGTFVAGDFLPVTVGLESGESVQLSVQVVTDCDEFEGLDQPASASVSPASEVASEVPSELPTDGATPPGQSIEPSAELSVEPSAAASIEEPGASSTPYSCENATIESNEPVVPGEDVPGEEE